MNIFITGGAGFIGRHVVKKLLKKHKITVFDNYSNSNHYNIREFFYNNKFNFIKGNILNQNLLKKSYNDIDLCIHLAAKINVQESIKKPNAYIENNIIGTKNILEICRKKDTPIIIFGTCMVYDFTNSAPINEKHAIRPKSPYAASKIAAEEVAISYYHGYGLPLTIVRPFNTYGPFQKSNGEGGVVNTFIKRYLERKHLYIYGNGEQTRDLLYIDDCVEFTNLIVEHSKGKGEIFNVGTGKDIAIKDLALMICNDKKRIKYIPHIHPQSEIPKLVCDYSKAKRAFGWEPTITLSEGIKLSMAWMKQSEKVT